MLYTERLNKIWNEIRKLEYPAPSDAHKNEYFSIIKELLETVKKSDDDVYYIQFNPDDHEIIVLNDILAIAKSEMSYSKKFTKRGLIKFLENQIFVLDYHLNDKTIDKCFFVNLCSVKKFLVLTHQTEIFTKKVDALDYASKLYNQSNKEHAVYVYDATDYINQDGSVISLFNNTLLTIDKDRIATRYIRHTSNVIDKCILNLLLKVAENQIEYKDLCTIDIKRLINKYIDETDLYTYDVDLRYDDIKYEITNELEKIIKKLDNQTNLIDVMTIYLDTLL